MHELVQNEKKESRARSLSETRTGLNVNNKDEEEKQQKRVAERAAKAMAQVLQRRGKPRSLMMWGDRKKAIIKRYPDGKQEIIVPQTLTPEQEQYQFPPRSKLLQHLDTSEAELRRLSVLQDHLASTAPTASSTLADPIENSMIQPDQSALNDWFSQKEKSAKDLQVIEWMNQVEQSKTQKNKIKVSSPTPSVCNSNKIQFKSDAGRRWANNITSNASLAPPDDMSKKHYVPRRLLSNYHKTLEGDSHTRMNDTVSQIQMIWKEYQSKAPSSNSHQQLILENKIAMAAMSSTGQRTPISGMMHLVQMLHHTLKVQQQKSNDRLAKLEYLLKEESKKRKAVEEELFQEKRQSSSLLSARVNPLTVRHAKKMSKDRPIQSVVSSSTYKRTSSIATTPSNAPSTKTRPSPVDRTSSKPVKKSILGNTIADKSISSTAKLKSRDRAPSLANTLKPKSRDRAPSLASTLKSKSRDRAPSLANTLKPKSRDRAPSLANTLKSKSRDRTPSLASTLMSKSRDRTPSLASTSKPKSRDRTSSLANAGIKSSLTSTSKPSTPQVKRQPFTSSR